MQEIYKTLRHEWKYYINLYEYHSLRGRLALLMQRDKHSVDSHGYHIRSLYFDDIGDSALLEKNYGIIKRKKYRIRIYNKSDRQISLERKSRQGNFVYKDSGNLTIDEYKALLTGQFDFLKKKNNALFDQFYMELMINRLRPTCIVDYVREAYTSELGKVRVTFDKELSAVINTIDVFDEFAVCVPVLLPPKLIMEVKFNKFLPSHLSEILHHSSSQRSAISKYVLCREVVKGAHLI